MRVLWIAALALVTGSALAQTGTMGGTNQTMGKSTHSMSGSNDSTHAMPATVSSVDHKTGLVEVSSGGMALKLHFPPPSLTEVKSGDKITLHLSFTKP